MFINQIKLVWNKAKELMEKLFVEDAWENCDQNLFMYRNEQYPMFIFSPWRNFFF